MSKPLAHHCKSFLITRTPRTSGGESALQQERRYRSTGGNSECGKTDVRRDKKTEGVVSGAARMATRQTRSMHYAKL